MIRDQQRRSDLVSISIIWGYGEFLECSVIILFGKRTFSRN